MTKYLSMNGSSDYLKTSNITFDRVVLSVKLKPVNNKWQTFFDARVGYTAYVLWNINNFWQMGGLAASVNGVNTSDIPIDTKIILELKTSTKATDDVNIFSKNNNSEFITGDVWEIKFYNGTDLIAHYDMSTGTVLDQSGNGNHATLVGGTWVDDGTGGTPTGTAVTTNYSLKQSVFANRQLSGDVRNAIYEAKSIQQSLTQKLFANRTQANDVSNEIYKNASDALATTQSIFAQRSSGSALAQSLYKQSSVSYDTLIELFNESVIRTDHFFLNIAIYKEASAEYQTRQQLTEAITAYHDMRQVVASVKAQSFATKQTIYEAISQDISTLQQMTETNSVDYDTLQRMLADYRIYKQFIEQQLAITRSVEKQATIRRIEFETIKLTRSVQATLKI